jgi:hypothetical protein
MADETRDEHLAWCKARALEYLDHGDLAQAVTSMTSDLGKHPETRLDLDAGAHLSMIRAVMDDDAAKVRGWIEGFR